MTIPSVAVIPAAGYGTRLFPATRIVKKEFFPIVGHDGIARPAILVIVEEALSAGVEDIILIVQPDDEALFRAFFKAPLPSAHYSRLSPGLQVAADRLLEIGERVHIAIQPTQEGFGHAVWCAHDAVGNQPFLLLLGDHVYHSRTTIPCVEQLCTVARSYEGSVISLMAVQEKELDSRGIVTGKWIREGYTLTIDACAEKPTPVYAREHLHISNLAENNYLAIFGQYILEPTIFDHLDRCVHEDRRERGEIQFTTALDALCRESGALGVLIEGSSHDFGQPRLYVDTLSALQQ